MTCIDLNEVNEKYIKVKELILNFTKNKLCTVTDIQKYLNKNNIDVAENEIIDLVSNNYSFLFWSGNTILELGKNIHYKTLYLKRKKSIPSGTLVLYDKYVSNPDEELKKHIYKYFKPTINKKILIDKTNYEKIKNCSFDDIGFIDGDKVYKVYTYTYHSMHMSEERINIELIGKIIKT